MGRSADGSGRAVHDGCGVERPHRQECPARYALVCVAAADLRQRRGVGGVAQIQGQPSDGACAAACGTHGDVSGYRFGFDDHQDRGHGSGQAPPFLILYAQRGKSRGGRGARLAQAARRLCGCGDGARHLRRLLDRIWRGPYKGCLPSRLRHNRDYRTLYRRA